jgi:hypothetical protein
LVAIHKPLTLLELAFAQSVLEANGIPYFVHNAGYASLYPGIQIDLLNVPTIMVPPSAVESAREVLAAYLGDRDGLRPAPETSWWHIARMLIEGFFCAWFIPRVGGREGSADEP